MNTVQILKMNTIESAQHSEGKSKYPETSRMIDYQYEYDINDNLRNNRPGVAKAKATPIVESQPDVVVHKPTTKAKDGQSPLVSLKT